MGQTSQPYVERAKELLSRADELIGNRADYVIARAQVNATLAVAAAIHDLTLAVRSTQSSVADNGRRATHEGAM